MTTGEIITKKTAPIDWTRIKKEVTAGSWHRFRHNRYSCLALPGGLPVWCYWLYTY